MFTSKPNQDAIRLSVELAGEIDETVNFVELIPVPAAEITVSCRGVTRINSRGVRAWFKFFRDLRAKGVKLRFSNLSPAVIDCCSLFKGFIDPAEVESFHVHMFCRGCRMVQPLNYKTAYGRESFLKMEELRCKRCHGKLMLDDDPAQYFRFFSLPKRPSALRGNDFRARSIQSR